MEKAAQVIAEHNQRLAKSQAELAPIVAQYPTVLLLGTGSLRGAIQVRGGADFAGGLLQDLGFQLVFPNRVSNDGGDVSVSVEALAQLSADLVIVQAWSNDTNGDHPMEMIRQQWNQTPVLQSMPASQNNRVCFVDYQLWSVSRGPIAAALILDQLSQLLRPLQP